MLLYLTVRRATAGSRRAAFRAGKKAAARVRPATMTTLKIVRARGSWKVMWAVLEDDEEGAVEPEIDEGHDAHRHEGEDYPRQHAADGEEAGLEEEEAPHLAALHAYGAHRAYLADALVHDDAEGVGDAHHDDEEEHDEDDEAGRVEDVDDLLHLLEHVVEGQHPVLDARPGLLLGLAHHGAHEVLRLVGLAALEDRRLLAQVLVEVEAVLVHALEGGQVEAEGLVILGLEVEELVDVGLVGVARHGAEDARIDGDAGYRELADVVLAGVGLHLHEDAVAHPHVEPLGDGLGDDQALPVLHALHAPRKEHEPVGEEGLVGEVHAVDGELCGLAREHEAALERRALGDVFGGNAHFLGGLHEGEVVADDLVFLARGRFLDALDEDVARRQVGEVLADVGDEGPDEAVDYRDDHYAEGYRAPEQEGPLLLAREVAKSELDYFHLHPPIRLAWRAPAGP